MLAKRIIPCLDVFEGKVVKGKKFKGHTIVGDIVERAVFYTKAGADELVFYDISASCDERTVDSLWIKTVAQYIDIPFCVAGGIRTLKAAEGILNAGADKISVNSPALENPDFITALSTQFGRQCVVVGIDSTKIGNAYYVFQYTGRETKIKKTHYLTKDWIEKVTALGAGEIVLNCMNQDGMKSGYDLTQLQQMQSHTHLPIIASGGAGTVEDFLSVFKMTRVSGALAASVFHNHEITIEELKKFLLDQQVVVRQ